MASKKTVQVAGVTIGGGAPIAVQTMWNKPLERIDQNLLTKLTELQKVGCDLIRFSTPSINSVAPVAEIAKKLSIPVVADIHYDYRIALECLKYPIAKLRLNPGNIGEKWKVREVANAAKDKGVPIRIGANAGSLPPHLSQREDIAQALVEAAEERIEVLQAVGFDDIIVSLKASEPEIVCQTNRIFAQKHDFPLHLGVTEAGPLTQALIKTTLAFAKLLEEGIGDTIRISIAGPPLEEVLAGVELLRSLKMRSAINIISCPGCARSTFDTGEFSNKIRLKLAELNSNLSVAVMGCPVNGPGEAAHADIGISGSGQNVTLFSRGKVIKTIPIGYAEKGLMAEVIKLHNSFTDIPASNTANS